MFCRTQDTNDHNPVNYKDPLTLEKNNTLFKQLTSFTSRKYVLACHRSRSCVSKPVLSGDLSQGHSYSCHLQVEEVPTFVPKAYFRRGRFELGLWWLSQASTCRDVELSKDPFSRRLFKKTGSAFSIGVSGSLQWRVGRAEVHSRRLTSLKKSWGL